MKKLLSVSSAKIYLITGFSILITLGSFWHHQINQTQLDKLSVLNQGVGTCFNRISQTFTAMMIKDVQSSYLNRGFMGLSDECLNETIKGINPFRKNVGKGYQTLNQLISEVHWFHEKIVKTHSPMLAGQTNGVTLAPISERYGKMETLKMDLVDEIDAASYQLRKIQTNDEYLMGSGLILLVIALTILSLQDFNRTQLRKELEREALNYLKAGKANVGAIVDQLVDRALSTQEMPVTAQIFRDYHEDLLENFNSKSNSSQTLKTQTIKVDEQVEVHDLDKTENYHKTSLKEILISIQNTQPKDSIHMNELRDVVLNVPYESFEQVMSAAINQLASRRADGKKIMIGNQIHSDKSVINLFLSGSTFSASELEFAGQSGTIVDGIDMNLVILKEMVREAEAQWHLENKTDRSGNITGMNIRFTVRRTPKEKSKLISLTRGKKKDLAKELFN